MRNSHCYCYKRCRFNRTFMELKFSIILNSAFRAPGFNRTFMELKLGGGEGERLSQGSFNRTFMELKFEDVTEDNDNAEQF